MSLSSGPNRRSDSCVTLSLFSGNEAKKAITQYVCDVTTAGIVIITAPAAWQTPTELVPCVQESFYAPHGDRTCTTATGIILPIILSNTVYFCVNFVAGRWKLQRRVQFWKPAN